MMKDLDRIPMLIISGLFKFSAHKKVEFALIISIITHLHRITSVWCGRVGKPFTRQLLVLA